LSLIKARNFLVARQSGFVFAYSKSSIHEEKKLNERQSEFHRFQLEID
jgi:hypothetical protein